MSKRNLLWYIKQLGRPVFTTYELYAASGKSASSVTQTLNFLQREEIIFKVYRGIWAETKNKKVSPYTLVPFLFPRQRAYLSFISALHLHGIIEQIPQTVTLASTAHTKIIRTALGVFFVHQISPLFFKGFGWYKNEGSFLIAEPEKALIDSLYISTRKKNEFGHFPELDLSGSFRPAKAKQWVKKIPQEKIRVCVQRKLQAILCQWR